ncbi:MAG TPA: hypothetical protein ENF49_04935 [Candidatus Altiarchaeales archaeon]|nr:hypothetical protein [Candidatus Altiarchaeales archaeon]HEX55454.1 hypothetical protein [Candidatus Altiarchaeales archaeon]
MREASIWDFVNLIYGISTAFATLLLIFHGFKFITASTTEDKREARNGLIYTLLGLFIIALALALVNFLYSRPAGY